MINQLKQSFILNKLQSKSNYITKKTEKTQQNSNNQSLTVLQQLNSSISSKNPPKRILNIYSTHSNPLKIVQNLKKQLSHCMLQTHLQTRKNLILKNLVKILEQQKANYDQRQKKQVQNIQDQNKKEIIKLKYDIDQLYQRYNQEIADIIKLKQQTDAARSQRVVYSKLFMKIQKQIKHYEQLYQKIIMNNQENKIKAIYQDFNQNQPILNNYSSQKQLIQMETRSKLQAIDLLSNNERARQIYNKLFLTNIMDQKLYSSLRKRVGSKRGASMIGLSEQQQKLNIIQQIQMKSKQLLVLIQCQTIDVGLQRYENIENQNNQFFEQIQEMNVQIEQLQSQIQQFKKQKKDKNTVTRQLSQLTIRSHRKIFKKKTFHQQYQKSNYLTIAKQICKILNFNKKNQIVNIDDETLDLIQKKISNLQTTQSNNCIEENKQKNIDVMMKQIQTFQNSNSAMNRKHFLNQYLKQVQRLKKLNKKKTLKKL